MSPEEAHAINRLMDAPPKYNPLRRYIAVYKIKGELSLSAIAFTNQIAAWTKPDGPRVPRDLEIIDVIDVKYEPVIIDQLPAPLVTRDNFNQVLDDVAQALNAEPQPGE